MTRISVRPPKGTPTRRGFITNHPPYRRWRPDAVAGLFEPAPLNLYIHTPYCVQRCAYCHYKTAILGEHRRVEIDRYVAAVCREIELACERLHVGERPVVSLYFGGGTPTLLSSDNLSHLMECVRANFALQDAEITIESGPVTLTERKATLLRELGVNRFSLGIQSFSDDIVAQTGRVDTEEQALEAIALAKDMGAVVNIDLLSGLAGETEESWARSLEQALAVDVHTLSIYKMELYANTGYYDALRKDELVLPTDEQELGFIRTAIARLATAGYLPVNFFTFGKGGGFAPRNLRSKWRGGDTAAFGLSAFGSLGVHSYQNTNSMERYLERVESGELPAQRGYRLSSRDLMVRDVVLGMKLLYIERDAFREAHGFDLPALIPEAVSGLVSKGLLEISDERIALSDEGMVWGDFVGRTLGDALERMGERRAQA
ncbi:coproporphyrinogen-III oxidase family protein [Haliangium ochraceum]|uniref:Coproporphyrinogen dehydrogenase n=1 Tax=Haliangium ochraceum (strain DSM 14365 / JCM 11303 / SMP-2) TaxID=502025 RepID=D0LQI4_HALO1|nr:coproporphyrinogen-III oxidase family protein [Haliangium ochraceum]ACY18993.1 Coproporphyrinogen dehydrogenase [Haliangium ochraceum DSM 14365]